MSCQHFREIPHRDNNHVYSSCTCTFIITYINLITESLLDTCIQCICIFCFHSPTRFELIRGVIDLNIRNAPKTLAFYTVAHNESC